MLHLLVLNETLNLAFLEDVFYIVRSPDFAEHIVHQFAYVRIGLGKLYLFLVVNGVYELLAVVALAEVESRLVGIDFHTRQNTQPAV